MNFKDAKQIVASYLTGAKVDMEDLEYACDFLNRTEPAYVHFLESEMGVPDRPTDLCEVFADRVAEYGEIPESYRQRELPELYQHLTVCESCRDLHREVYLSAFAGGVRRVAGELRRLGETIRLVLSWSGALTQTGFGPGAVEPGSVVAEVLGALPEAKAMDTVAKEREWDIPLDEARNLSIRLGIRASARKPGHAELTFALTGRGAAAESAMRFEYSKEGTATGSGRVADFQTSPLILDAGSWLLRLRNGEGVTWEIPLVLDRED